MQHTRVLNDTDKQTISDQFFDILMKSPDITPDVKDYLKENKETVLKEMDNVIKTRFPDQLTTNDLSDKENVKELAMGSLMAVFLGKPNEKKETMMDSLLKILKKAGLVQEDEANKKDKPQLTPAEKAELKKDLQEWAEKMLKQFEDNKLLPKLKPGFEKKAAETLANTLTEDVVDKGLLNLYGVNPNATGGIAFPVFVQVGNGLGIRDMNPNNGGAPIDSINNAFDSNATGGDPLGLNAITKANYESQGDALEAPEAGSQEAAPETPEAGAPASGANNLVDSLMSVLEDNNLAKANTNTPKFEPPGSS